MPVFRCGERDGGKGLFCSFLPLTAAARKVPLRGGKPTMDDGDDKAAEGRAAARRVQNRRAPRGAAPRGASLPPG